jgi:hypothetical protein
VSAAVRRQLTLKYRPEREVEGSHGSNMMEGYPTDVTTGYSASCAWVQKWSSQFVCLPTSFGLHLDLRRRKYAGHQLREEARTDGLCYISRANALS